jgi:hypothetical protein
MFSQSNSFLVKDEYFPKLHDFKSKGPEQGRDGYAISSHLLDWPSKHGRKVTGDLKNPELVAVQN